MIVSSHDRSNQGFTLVEVLVALFILIIGIVAVMQMLPRSILQSRMAAERTVGSQVARDVMGAIRQANAESITTGALINYDENFRDDPLTPGTIENDRLSLLNVDRAINVDDADAVARSISVNGLFGYQTIFQPMPNAEITHLHRVTMVFDYTDGRTETYTTYVSKK